MSPGFILLLLRPQRDNGLHVCNYFSIKLRLKKLRGLSEPLGLRLGIPLWALTVVTWLRICCVNVMRGTVQMDYGANDLRLNTIYK
jgi:hypothetical protein